jgi:GNAT superfamily N-acetyltransferase
MGPNEGRRGDGPELLLRRATDEDRPGIIKLCRASLGWEEGDPNESFFAWKHDENAFGPSPSWVAEAPDGSLAGLRVFLRWRFRDGAGRALQAVRAVDTATHPDWQGKGIFTKLTLGALPDLQADGIDLVFNTPNDKSRPGYLKMGWSEVGKVPVGVRFGGLGTLRTVARARTAAEMWSEESAVGESAVDVLADTAAVQRLLDSCAPEGRITTDRSPAYLQWRYRFDPLRYRAVLVGDSIEDGLVILRLRRRGPALECAVCEVLVPGRRSARRTMSQVARDSSADYLLRCSSVTAGLRDAFVPAPQLGPILTWRPLGRPSVPAMGDLSLTLGDVELF